jgi:hypothetical protein
VRHTRNGGLTEFYCLGTGVEPEVLTSRVRLTRGERLSARTDFATYSRQGSRRETSGSPSQNKGILHSGDTGKVIDSEWLM